MKKPKFDVFVEFVKKYNKSVGLRILYKQYDVTTDKDKRLFRTAWDEVKRGLNNAAEIRSKSNDNTLQHSGNDGVRTSAETGCGGGDEQGGT